MNNLPQYNPCEEYIEKLSLISDDDIVIDIKHDKRQFITNLCKADYNAIHLDMKDIKFSDNGRLIIDPSDDFFRDGIRKCPVLEEQYMGNIKLDSIVKRMFAQIQFGFFKEGEIGKCEIDICDNIFKSIYTKSLSIKTKNIEESLQKYNSLQKTGYINKSIIYGIIYSVYDYANCAEKL